MSLTSKTGLIFSAVIMFVALAMFIDGMNAGNSSLARAADASGTGVAAEGRESQLLKK